MRRLGLSYEEALAYVRARRAIVHPNSGFAAQLRAYEQELAAAEQSQPLSLDKDPTAITATGETMTAIDTRVTTTPTFGLIADPDAVRLHNSSSEPCACPGLVFVAEWGWAEGGADDTRRRYETLRERTQQLSNGMLYTYPAHASHITIATLSSFKKPDAPRRGLSQEADAKYCEAWVSMRGERAL